jgi:sialidase-1
VVELADGTLMMNSRYTGPEHVRAITLSSDGGETWGETVLDERLIDPICQGSILMTDNGLVFSNPATQREFPRDHLSVRISYDEGATWPYIREIDDGPSAYSALAQLSDGRIGVLWESGDVHPYEKIRFASFNRAWLEAAD